MTKPGLNPRSALVMLHDAAAGALAWLTAHWLRFNLDIPPEYLHAALVNLAWVVPLQAGVFFAFGLYRGLWRFASLPDLRRILLAVAVGATLVPVVLVLFRVQAVVPRSVLLMDPLLLVLMMGGSRLLYRAWKEHRLSVLAHPEARPALILGAGSAADFLLRELRRNPSGLRPVGLLDDDPGKLGRRVQDIPVLGPLASLTEVAKRLGVEVVVLAMPAASHGLRRRVAEVAESAGLELLTVPALEDLVAGRVRVDSLRPLNLEDLLGRDPVQLDDAGLARCIGNRVVLVTGAGGSIGSELCRQILRFGPTRLLLVDASEFALYRIDDELRVRAGPGVVVPLVADVRDTPRMLQILETHRPAIVYHAAAYKHVPLMEVGNAMEALRNNVLGTHVTARAAVAAGVEKFVLVSTDKAVNPTNVMGASKRLAEMVCQALQGSGPTRFVAVRFGNVIGSSGSVVPRFQAQIAAGGPITVTHPEVTRYFMTIPEAAQLVLQAGLMGQGGEIFVLDMGEPVKIVELARLMLRLAGKTEAEVPIVYTGLRPGEKLYEEVLADAEHSLPTYHPKLRVAQARAADRQQVGRILAWIEANPTADEARVREMLQQWLPEYRGSSVQQPSGAAMGVSATGARVIPLRGRFGAGV